MTKFKSLFMVFCLLLSSNAKVCKEGFVRLRHWCLYFHLEPTSLLKSRQICHKMGGHMIKMDSEMKEDTIIKYLKVCKDYEKNYKRKQTRYFHIPTAEIPLGSRAKDRAKFTTPAGFSVKLSSIQNAGFGVWTDSTVPKYTVLGDYEGEEHTNDKLPVDYSWQVFSHDGKFYYYIDAIDPSKSNWVRWINMPRNAVEENVCPIYCAGVVLYMTMYDILPNTELMVYYGNSYAMPYGIKQVHPAWDFDFENNFYIRIGVVRESYDDFYDYYFEDGTPVKYSNWGIGEDERELPEEFGVLLEIDGEEWSWTGERNYSYFTGREGLKVPFICEE